jgi:hypothetical protein
LRGCGGGAAGACRGSVSEMVARWLNGGVEEIGHRWGRLHACWRGFRMRVSECPDVSWHRMSGR